jgi:nitrate reductase molybdenum cofactor assembly chaperone NarJ/NarW
MAIYGMFADILDYPGREIGSQVRACVSALATEYPAAAESVARFEAEQAGMSLGELQEIYTSTFDLGAEGTPNLGYHLFGNDTRRNIFMAQLKQRMDAHHIVLGKELPDHLSLVLRLLEEERCEDERLVLVEDCLVPAISRLVGALGQHTRPNPYGNLLQALVMLLQKQTGAEKVAQASHPGMAI